MVTDQRLVAWARAVKARARRSGGRSAAPVLWLFTDADRCPDPLPSIAALPRIFGPGLCGVVFRHDGVPGRMALAARVAALCRRRGIALSIAGDWRLAARLHAGVHCRARVREPARGRFRTASAHDRAELLRARRLGALIFLSPVFATRSHLGARPLGPVRWAAIALGGWCGALGGIDARSVRRLPRHVVAVGAVGALGAMGVNG